MGRFHVQRSTRIQAPPDQVFQTLADYRSWTTWSPWLCAEPTAQVQVTPDASSVGAVYSWKGDIVGSGEIEHRQLQPGRRIEDELRFVKPFRSRSEVVFELAPAADGTEVTWHMHGSLPWFMFWMRPQMETYIGMDYERGLKMLKELIETGQVLSKTNIVGVKPFGPLRLAGVHKTCASQDIGPSMEAAMAEATQRLTGAQVPTDGEMIALYHSFDLKSQTFDFIGGYVIPETVGALPPNLSTCWLPAGRALCVEHTGSYHHLGNAWSAAYQFARYQKLKQSKSGSFELYKNHPGQVPAAELRTEIYLPLR